jgi:hypothetical protein
MQIIFGDYQKLASTWAVKFEQSSKTYIGDPKQKTFKRRDIESVRKIVNSSFRP